MITATNFSDLLLSLNFTEKNRLYTKKINGVELKADFANQKLIYPEGIQADRDTTKNFSQPENFVVFECVHNLLLAGYKPEHIILEKGLYGGHGMTGGFSDIIVQNNAQEPYLLIECKTADDGKSKEFSRAWAKMQQDGGQLFSYYINNGKAQWLCLYTSDFKNNKTEQIYHLISMVDNVDYLKNNITLKSFEQVRNENGSKADYFSVWSNTYQQDFITHNLFESEVFKIGNRPYSVADLKSVDSDAIGKKYHQFATIMRRHNVSARENAFDKLVNLFLCKVVDEKHNSEALKVYWKGAASDNHYDLQDRLQQLYQIGMREFLNEDVTYISEETLDNAFHLFKNQKDETKRTVLNYFTQLKFYSNNPFAFLDVHNEKLFFQNAIILKEIVQMLQDIKLKNDQEQHQFLGDLFEGFLDQGVKQSEGQFFTPMPIVKFLISSLPLKSILSGEKAPKVIDYACGAGHFLTEFATQIKPLLKDGQSLTNYYQNIYGIEKEYRLSKVAKVSAFMYGQDEMKIIYADALAQNKEQEKELADGSFSLLVANPPYSVKGFLTTLSDDDKNRFDLYRDVSDEESFNSIETFFIEKAKQLLHSDGIAVIVLPSSILTNGSIYIKCREILLKYFDLIAIAEFGSGTFGKTGTNTVTLFLRRKSSEPDISLHFQNRIEHWQAGNFKFDGLFEDVHLLKAYCKHCGFVYEQYLDFLKATQEIPSDIAKTEVFIEYRKIFDKKKFNKTSNIEMEWVKFAKAQEGDKLHYFMLAQESKQNVLVVKMPSDTKEKKAFLGYEWSSAKGNEGIKYITTQITDSDDVLSQLKGINQIQTPLFNPNNLNDEHKINSLIRQTFEQEKVQIPENLQKFVQILPLVNMLDFSRAEFDKAIVTTVTVRKDIQSKYPIVKLGDVCDIRIGGTPARSNGEYFTGQNLWVSISEMKGNIITDTKEKINEAAIKNSNVKLIPNGTTLLSFKLSIGKTAIAGKDLYTNEAIAGLIPKDKLIILDNYLFYLFNGKLINLENVGNKAFGKSLNSKYLREDIKIPLPPLEVQQKIVEECKKIDNEFENSRMQVEEYRAKIANIFNDLEITRGGVKRFKINELCKVSSGGTPSRSQSEYWIGGTIPWVKTGELDNKILMSTEEYITEKGLENSSAKWYKKGSIIIAMYGATIGQTAKLGIDATTNQACAVLFDFQEIANNDYVWYFLRTQTENLKQLGYGSAQPNLNAKIIAEFQIPIPSIAEQQEIITQIEIWENKIAELEMKMAQTSAQKARILEKYL